MAQAPTLKDILDRIGVMQNQLRDLRLKPGPPAPSLRTAKATVTDNTGHPRTGFPFPFSWSSLTTQGPNPVTQPSSTQLRIPVAIEGQDLWAVSTAFSLSVDKSDLPPSGTVGYFCQVNVNGTANDGLLGATPGLIHTSTVVAGQFTLWVVTDTVTVVNLDAGAEVGEADFTGLVYTLSDSIQFGFSCEMDITYIGNFS